MAYAKVFQPFDMATNSVWYGYVEENSSTRLEIKLGSKVAIYEGDFDYDSYGGVSGTLNSVTEYDSGGKLYEIKDFSASAEDFYYAIQALGSFGTAASLALSGNDTLIGSTGSDGLYGFSGKDLIKGRAGNDDLFGDGGADKIIGGSGRDTIDGGGQRDKLFGGSGRDYLEGGGGKDRLFGGGGSDVLSGGRHSDRLSGGRGDDDLIGGAGRDTFIFAKGDGRDTVMDFDLSRDILKIGQGANKFRDIEITQDGNDVHFSFANVHVTLLNLDADEIGREHFIF